MNTVAHRAFSRKLEIDEYFSPKDNGNWKDFSLDFSSNIATVNAYYNPTSNTMVVPIGMLQPPIFWSKPKSLTFGAFGIVVGECNEDMYRCILNRDIPVPLLWKKIIVNILT